MNVASKTLSRRRRGLLAAATTWATWSAWPFAATRAQAQPTPASGGPPGSRLALLIGNRDYPNGQDLPSMHTNVRDLRAALEAVGFEVTSLLDGDRPGAVRAVDAFRRRLDAMPADGVALFYFCGHGMQIDADNFLLPSRVVPRERSLKESLDVYVALWQNVIEKLPRRPAGLTITVVDACRTSPQPLSADDGLNQVKAPVGELIVFSTGAGQPALAPTDETRRTFFTDALVRQVEQQARAPEELSFRELFQQVRTDVQTTMKNHPVEDIRALAQLPFIADNTGRPVRVALRLPPAAPTPTDPAGGPGAATAEEAAFASLQQTLWPGDVVKQARDFASRFPQSRFRSAAMVAGSGASEAAQLLARTDISLYRRDFSLRPELGEAFNEDLRRAGRGDKDAAARVGSQLKSSAAAGPTALRYEGWMQYAAELGNGIASYELARHYSDLGQPALVGKWVSRARQLGYTPPPQLRITR